MNVLLPPSFQKEYHGATMEHTKNVLLWYMSKNIISPSSFENMVVLCYSDVSNCNNMVQNADCNTMRYLQKVALPRYMSSGAGMVH